MNDIDKTEHTFRCLANIIIRKQLHTTYMLSQSQSTRKTISAIKGRDTELKEGDTKCSIIKPLHNST
jgi:hypothetical protein